ncbi:histidine phosphatase family protein [Tessaracoccus sp. MC1756]|uniref:histidine phosphatase family protein n=1 Tax=Tessaracoccus sp. MC1756 TaxID=2760311 RepID=UPI0015FFD57D|nr:histidine phosphatase family protein [Tessaracoccus sp. MC1756]
MRIAHATRLVLLRHGETDHNAQGRFQGHADIPVNDTGRRQAEAARDRLAPFHFDAVYTSPLVRAAETARIVRPEAQFVVDPRLMEINVGSWAGLTWGEVHALMPDYEAKYADGVDFRRSPEGETLAEVVERGRPALLEIAERHDGGTALIVSHGLFLNRVLHSLLGLEGRVLGSLANAHHSEVGHAHGAWRLLAHNVG